MKHIKIYEGFGVVNKKQVPTPKFKKGDKVYVIDNTGWEKTLKYNTEYIIRSIESSDYCYYQISGLTRIDLIYSWYIESRFVTPDEYTILKYNI